MFQFMTSTRIIFGEGSLASSLSLLNQFGYSVLLVTGQNLDRASTIVNYLESQSMRYQHIAISGEPNIKMVEEAATSARRFNPEMVISIGGGSVIDMGKALAAIVPNQGDLYDYVEVVGRNVPLKAKPLPFIAIPTTASTGAEVTKNAVLKSGQDQVKISLRSPDMLAELSIIDPQLTYGTDSLTSGRGAMDIFTHLMEAYVCGQPNPLTDMICEEGLRKLSNSIEGACLRDEPQHREALSFSAMLGGMAITNAKLGAAHGLASALGGKLNAPHSVIAGRLAPYVMAENIVVAKELGRHDILQRYLKVAQIVTQNPNAAIEDSIAWLQGILNTLSIPSLSSYGILKLPFNEVALDALKSVAIKGNPLPLNYQRLIDILEQVSRCHSDVDLVEQYSEPKFSVINSFSAEQSVSEKGNSWTI